MKLKHNSINYSVDTVDALLTLVGEENDVVVVTDENRGGTFVYRSADSATNNSGTIFNGWTRQYDGAVNVKWFGAKGDGASAGSTFITDDTLAIQKALDYTNSVGNGNPFGDYYGGEVYFPKGNYTISDTIIVYPNSVLSGEGIDNSEIQARPNSPTTGWEMFNIPDRAAEGSEKVNRNIEFKNLSINGNDYSGNYSSNIIGVAIANAIYCKFTNMEIKQCDSYGLKIKNDCSNFFITNSLFRDSNSTQVVVEGSSAIFFNGGEIRTGSSWGIIVENDISGNVNFNGVGFVNSRYGGISVTNSSSHILVSGCSFINGGNEENADSAAIRFSDSDSKGININGNNFYLIKGKAIYFEGEESQIIGNMIHGCRYDGIYVNSGADIEIKNNSIIDSGYYSDNTYKGIYCNSYNTNITGNVIKTRNFSEKPSHSISLGASASNVKITDNDLPSSGYSTKYLEANAAATYQAIRNKSLMDDVWFSVKFNADENVAHNVSEILDFDNVEFDISSNWNYVGSNNAYFEAPSDGIYEFNLSVEVSENTNTVFSFCYVTIQTGATGEVTRYPAYLSGISDSTSTDNRNTYNVTCMAQMEAGWRAYAKGYIDSDNDVTVDDKSYFQGKKVR